MRPALAVVVVVVFGAALAGIGTGGPPPHGQPAGARVSAPTSGRLAASKRRVANSAASRRGAAIFDREGCDACHSVAATGAGGRLGPRLDALYDPRAVVIEDIVEPRKVITPGFQADLMPTDYARRLDPAEIAALAAFIKAASGKP